MAPSAPAPCRLAWCTLRPTTGYRQGLDGPRPRQVPNLSRSAATTARVKFRFRPLPAALPQLQQADWSLGVLVLAGALLAVPTWARLAQTVWVGDQQGHGPLVLAVAGWLVWRRHQALAALPLPERSFTAWLVLALGLCCLAVGRSQTIVALEVVSLPVIAAGLLLLMRGVPGLRLCAFPVFFLLFTVPLPSAWVYAATAPLKLAVSTVATDLLHVIGYPVGRSGVVLLAGPYQLLVADACAGLNSILMLEALVLLYVNLMGYADRARNLLLVLAALPISFVANVVRVVVLVLITVHGGEAAGRGFVHGFAGVLLMLVALFLTAGLDKVYGVFAAAGPARR